MTGAPMLDGACAAVEQLRRDIRRVAPTDLAVAVSGETGTGKERVARCIHALSSRASRDFVVVDCAALPGSLAHAELFGHVRGAFTGAGPQRDGLFHMADGGTLFFDEIADLSLDMQSALLRVLSEGTVRRLGGNQGTAVDVRVISSTAQDLRAQVASGRFRQDLLFRLTAVELVVPPLRARGDDVVALARQMLAAACAELGGAQRTLSEAAEEACRRASWTGNLRELQNVMRRAAVLSAGEQVEPCDLRLAVDESLPSLREVRASAERLYLERLLYSTRGNVSAAARRADVHRTELHRLLRRHGLHAADFRGGEYLRRDS